MPTDRPDAIEEPTDPRERALQALGYLIGKIGVQPPAFWVRLERMPTIEIFYMIRRVMKQVLGEQHARLVAFAKTVGKRTVGISDKSQKLIANLDRMKKASFDAVDQDDSVDVVLAIIYRTPIAGKDSENQVKRRALLSLFKRFSTAEYGSSWLIHLDDHLNNPDPYPEQHPPD